jgi:SAM-dependent methyltransferase/uncharacterized protein YbaR (Trm112 family)
MTFPATIERLACPHCGPATPLRLAAGTAIEPGGEILAGVLRCTSCPRWFRIQDGVADLVRDGLRERAEERAFLATQTAALDPTLLAAATAELDRLDAIPTTEDDARIVEEGRHWGRFMARFWEVADRSIFDMAIKGTHPRQYPIGVLEVDDRDVGRPYSFFPPATGRMLFGHLHTMAGEWGVDIGCGGGQMGLAAARAGLYIVGFDPAWEALVLARRHARSQGIDRIDYVRGEPGAAPLQARAFGVAMAKDSLHHVPNLPAALDRIGAALRPGARFLCHEHIARAPWKEALLGPWRPRAVRKIRSRWANTAVPEEFLRDSANEDVAAHLVEGEIRRRVAIEAERHDLFLAEEVESMLYFAYGKRRWLSTGGRVVAMVLERLMVLAGQRQHWSAIGRWRD